MMRDVIEILLLILVANGAPVVVSYLFSHRSAYPVDGGFKLADGYAVFGQTKTWRGILSSVLATIALALLLDINWFVGLLIALVAMAGDLLSSFIKRRSGLEPSSRAIFLDQIPESLLPALAASQFWPLGLIQVMVIVVSFFILEIILSKIFYKLGVRTKPY